MAIYTIDPIGAQYPDPILQAAKQFMGSPDYSRKFMDNVQGAMQRQTHVPGDGFYGSGQPHALSMSDMDLLAGVLTAEGGSPQDMRYISNVIANRVASPSYPNTVRDVLMQPGQFSALNRVTGYAGGQGANDLWRNPTDAARGVALSFLRGLPDATGGALNYYQPQLANPAWGGPHFRPLPGSTHVFGTA